MSIPVLPPGVLIVGTRTQELAELARQSGVEQNHPVVPVGSILQLLISEDRNKQLGVNYGGKFFPAQIPLGLSPGDLVKVAVQNNTDALVLKLLATTSSKDGLSPGFKTAPASMLLDDLLDQILPKEVQSQIRSARSAKGVTLPSPTKAASEAHSPIPAPKSEVSRIIENLFARQVLANDQTLSDPAQITQVMKNLSHSPLIRGVQDAARAVENLSRGSPPHSLVRVAEALVEHIEQLIATHDPTIALLDKQATAARIPPISRDLTTALSQYALATGNYPLLQQLSSYTSNPQDTPDHSPIDQIIKQLTQFVISPESMQAPLAAELDQVVTLLKKVLEQARDQKAITTEHKQILQQLKDKLQNSLRTAHGGVDQSKEADQGKQFLKGLETMLSGQEILNQYNPLLHAFGQPALLMLPALVAGNLLQWTMQVAPPQVEEDGRGNKQDPQSSERVTLDVTLPSLGHMVIALMRRDQELFLSITVESEERARFLSQEIERFSSHLQRQGVTLVQAHVKQGDTHNKEPQLLRGFGAREVVA